MKRLAAAACLVLASCAEGEDVGVAEGAATSSDVDILYVGAHPDDDTIVAGYLARASLDEGRKIVAVIATRGEKGPNVIGPERDEALAAIRDKEARAAFGSIGIKDVRFLGVPDTRGQSFEASFKNWNHDATLKALIGIVRETRPKVILSFLPSRVVGQNHGDHQASSIVSVEAFDASADARVHPELGLEPWQPQKLYFFSDADDLSFIDGRGATYSSRERSKSQGVSFAHLIALESSFYRTQPGIGLEAEKALEAGRFQDFSDPTRLLLGRSLVPCARDGDVFDGVGTRGPAPDLGGPPSEDDAGDMRVELGGPWAFYRTLWRDHRLTHLGALFRHPQVSVDDGDPIRLPIRIENRAANARSFHVGIASPKSLANALPSGVDVTVPAQSERTESLELPVPARLTRDKTHVVEVVVSAGSGEARTIRVDLHPYSF
jgi:LmbE family N-acetylglucosaminyl deacetylase